jgi:hypothetical protein
LTACTQAHNPENSEFWRQYDGNIMLTNNAWLELGIEQVSIESSFEVSLIPEFYV